MSVRVRRFYSLASLTVALSSCTSAGTAFGPPVQVANIAKTATLQLAVGTATIAYNGGSTVGTNFVATFRGSDGNNATGSNTPTLSGPAGFNFGISFGNGPSITGVLPSTFTQAATSVQNGQAYPVAFGEGFGPFTGVFGYGFASDNTISNAVSQSIAQLTSLSACFGVAVTGNGPSIQTSTGVPTANGVNNVNNLPPTNVVHSAELGLPIPSGLGNTGAPQPTCPQGAANAGPFLDTMFPANYYGGPPAWPSPQGYGNPAYFVGYPLGFSTFLATPVGGTYSLDVAFATSADYGTYGHLSTTATLKNVTPLGPISTPSLQVNADGSGVLTVTVPAGVTETIVMVRTVDCNLSVNGPLDNYAVVVRGSGRIPVTFSANLGPPDAGGHPKHTFCTVSDVQAYNANAVANGLPPQPGFTENPLLLVAAFDYPAYEASYPFNVSPSPKITSGDGHTGQADVTTSYPVLASYTVLDPAVTASAHR